MENQENQGLIDLQVILPKVLKRWYVFVVLLPIFLGASKVYLKYQTPAYKVNSSLRVGAGKSTHADALLNEISPFESVGYDVFDEITVMKSYALAQRTISGLDINVAYFVSGKIKRTQLYKQVPFKVTLDTGNTHVVEGISFVVSPVSTQEYELTVDVETRYTKNLNGVHRYGEILKLADSCRFYLTLVDTDWEKEDDVIHEFSMKSNNTLYNEFSRIQIGTDSKKSSIIKLEMLHQVPELAIHYMNGLMESYCNRDYNNKLSSLTKSLAFLRKQISETQSELTDRELIAQRLKEDTKIYDLDAAADNTYQQILVLQEEKERFKLQENYYDLVITYIQKHRAFSDLVAPSLMGIDDPMVASIVKNLKEIYVMKAKKEFSAQDNNPTISTLNLAQQKTIDIALENLNHGLKRIEFNMKSIEQQMEEKFVLLKSLPSAELSFLRIKREIDGLNNLLEFLVEREAALGISASRIRSNHQVIDYARLFSKVPVSPMRSFISLVFCLIGALLSLLIVYFLEFFKSKVSTVKELETSYGNKVFGTLPFVKQPTEIDVVKNPKSIFAENMRVLKHRLDFVLPNTPEKDAQVIAFTSAVSGEGKTFLAAKLAATFAVSDHKVLLLGADLRKPKLSQYFKEIKDKGLSEYLVGNTSLEEVITKSDNENLDCILSGEIPPNPAVLLSNKYFEELIKRLKYEYDYILIDSPPVGLVSDYNSLKVDIDLTIFIVRQHYTLVNSLKNIQGYNLTNAQVVFNGVKDNILSQYSSNYGYGQGYYQED